MTGQIKYAASFSMDELALSCTGNERHSFQELTALAATSPPANLANFVPSPSLDPLPLLAIVARGATPAEPAKKLFQATIYVQGTLADVEVYRLL